MGRSKTYRCVGGEIAVSFGGGKHGFPRGNLYAVTFTGLIVELADVID